MLVVIDEHLEERLADVVSHAQWSASIDSEAAARGRPTAQQETIMTVMDLLSSGRITPQDAMLLLELRRRLAWARLPWWHKALVVVGRILFD